MSLNTVSRLNSEIKAVALTEIIVKTAGEYAHAHRQLPPRNRM